MEPTTIGWVAAAALIVGAIVRLLKSESLTIALANMGLPPIPKRVLPWVALLFGLASSILDERVMGTAWPAAITKGVIAALTAITGHELAIESLRKGKELLALALLIGGLLFGTSACTRQERAEVKSVTEEALNDEQIACTIANAAFMDSKVAELCNLVGPFIDPMKNLLSVHRKKLAEARVSARREVCASIDGGAPACALDGGAP